MACVGFARGFSGTGSTTPTSVGSTDSVWVTR